jgi:hypothetical protein
MNDSNSKASTTRRGMRTLGQSVTRVSSPVMRRRGFAEAAILTNWDSIVGQQLADHSQPSRIVFPRGERAGGTLHLRVSSAFAPDIQHLAPQIIERINGHFGYAAIARLELHQGWVTAPDRRQSTPEADIVPAPDPALTEAIAKVEGEQLGAALDRLVQARALAQAKSKTKSQAKSQAKTGAKAGAKPAGTGPDSPPRGND